MVTLPKVGGGVNRHQLMIYSISKHEQLLRLGGGRWHAQFTVHMNNQRRS